MKRALGLVLVALALAACGDAAPAGGGGGDGAALVGGPGTTAAQGLPPSSQVWFGTAYDSGTMTIYDKGDKFKASSPLVAVGTLITPRDRADVKVTVEINGSIKSTLQLSDGGNGATYGVDLSGQKFTPGSYLISFTSATGKSLASASVTIQP